MIEVIKSQYVIVQDKQAFCHELGEELGLSGAYIFNHWFGKYLNIPLKYRLEVLQSLNQKVKLQMDEHEKVYKLGSEAIIEETLNA